jgi:hypothetical protein
MSGSRVRDGRALGGCGHVFSATSEFRYLGTLTGFQGAIDNPGPASDPGYVFHSDQSPQAGLVASVRTTYELDPGTSREVLLHEDHYLTQVGSLRLPAFSVNGVPLVSYARYAFFSEDGKRLDVLAQADPGAGVVQDYGLISADVTRLKSCPSTPPTSIPVDGNQQGSVSLTPLDFDVIDATLSRALDRVVVVSDDPPQLRLLDPASANVTASVALALAPNCVELESDGLSALIGHDGWVTRVSLAQTQARVSAISQVATDAFDVAATGGKAIVVPARDQSTWFRVVDMATGADAQGAAIRAGSHTERSPDGQNLFTVLTEHDSDDDMRRMSITDAQKVPVPNSFDYGYGGTDVATHVGHQFWFASDGKRLFGSGAGVFDLHDPTAASFAKLGALQGLSGVRALDHAANRGRIAVVSREYDPSAETAVRLFDDSSYMQLASTPLPGFVTANGSVQTHGRFLFLSADATEIYVLVEAVGTQPLSSRFGLVRMPVAQ